MQAKGLEDTAFFRYNLLLSLNEVGNDIERFGRSVEEFHDANTERLRHWPSEMLATATHDSKLGEDTRARINVLSEIPDEWTREVTRWMRLNRAHRTLLDGEPAPDRNDEYRFYQALVGVWPVDPDAGNGGHDVKGVRWQPDISDLAARLRAYMLKSVKEAKRHTSWLTPNDEYEAAVARFVEGVLTGPGGARFLPAFTSFAARVAQAGMVNGLSQLVLKLGSPGVPDFYQGSELWDLSLVDPDNRRPIDFDHRRRLLAALDAGLSEPLASRAAAVSDMVGNWRDGRVKMLLTTLGLRLRKEWPEVFTTGRYLPLVTDVTVSAGLVAFARIHEDRAALFIAPRFTSQLTPGVVDVPLGGEAWKTTRIILPPELRGRTFQHHLTGAEILPTAAGGDEWIFAGQVFETIPVGILRTTD